MLVSKIRVLALGLALVSTGSGVLYADISEGVISYYPMDGNADDIIGVNNGVAIGPTPAIDRFGNPEGALSFDGVDDYIDIGNDSSLKPSFPITISAWVLISPDSTEAVPIFDNNFTENSYYGVFMNILPTGELAVHYGDSGQPSNNSRRSKIGTTILEFGIWYHVVGRIGGYNDIELFVNGKNDGGTYSGMGNGLAYNNNPGSIGRLDASRFEDPIYAMGSMDDIILYNRALNASEVEELFTGLPSFALTYNCVAFGPPLHKDTLKINGANRVIPVTAQLQSPEDGKIIADEDLIAPPLIQILYTSESGEVVVSGGATAIGWGFDRNVFEYDPNTETWRYGLRVSNFTDPGTYMILMISGDEWEYHVDSCTRSFEIVQKKQK